MEHGILTVLGLVTSPLDPPQELPLTLYDKRGEPFEVRTLRSGDPEALLHFYEAFEPKRAAQGLPPSGTERIRRWLDAVLPHGLHLLAQRDGELIGHALLMPTPREGVAEYAVFLGLQHRGRGVGTELNRAAIGRARGAGLRRLWLTVAPHNRPAIRSYEKVGFRFRPATLYSPEAEMELDL